MSGKRAKKLRRELKKTHMTVFQDFVIEIAVMPFYKRFWFCWLMAWCRHGLQKGLKDIITERRRLTPDGKPVKWYNRPIGDFLWRKVKR